MEIIGIRGDEELVESLKPLVNDPDEDVKVRAVEILKKHNKYELVMEKKSNTETSANLQVYPRNWGRKSG